MEIKCARCGEINSFFDDEVDQVIITDNEGIILYVNQSMLDATGYSLSEVIGQTPGVWGGHMSKQFYKDLWHKIKDKKQVATFEVLNKKKNGETYKAILRISPILDVNSKPSMFLGIETKVNKDGKAVKAKKTK